MYEIQYYKDQNRLIDIGSATGNIRGTDAAALHEVYNKNIANAWYDLGTDTVMFVAFSGKAAIKSSEFVRNIFDKEFKFFYKVRKRELEKLAEQSAGEIELNVSSNIYEHMYNFRKVTDEEFNLFKNAIATKTLDDYIGAKWPSLIKYLPKQQTAWENLLDGFKKKPTVKEAELDAATKIEIDRVLELFIQKAVTNNQDVIRNWLKPLFRSKLLTVQEWEKVTEIFNRELRTIEDCKAFMKVVKYSKKQYGIRAQLSNFLELLNPAELRRPAVYAVRTEKVLMNFNDYFDIARYTGSKNLQKLIEDTEAFIAKGKTFEQVEAEIKRAFATPFEKSEWEDFNLQKLLDRKDEFDGIIESFEASRSDILENIENIGTRSRSVQFLKDELKYEKRFLKFEEKYNDKFRQKYKKYFGKTNDVGVAFKKALLETQVQKRVENDCSFPESPATLATNRLYQKFAEGISLGTNVMGYVSTHATEEKNMEWFTRGGYDTVMGFLGARLHSRVFTKTGGGPLYKIVHDYLAADLVSGVSAFAYQFLSNNVWNTDEKYQEQFEKIINQSIDTEKNIREFFQKNPKLETEIMNRFLKLKARFDEAGDSSEAQELMFKEELAKMIFEDNKTIYEKIGQEGLYNRMVDSEYLDLSDYPQQVRDEDVEDQLYAYLAKMKYDSLYENKSGVIKYPIFDPIEVGNLGWIPEAKWGPRWEGADRFSFYAVYDIGAVALAYPKNAWVYKILCRGRYLPNNQGLLMALGVHLLYQSAMDPISYYFRNQVTGH